MMKKKKIITIIVLAVFIAVSLFGFSACDNGTDYDDSALIDRIEALEEQIAEQNNKINDQQEIIDEQDTLIAGQAAAVTALQNSLKELQESKAELEEQITALESDNTANKADIAMLKTKVEALEAANENFRQEISLLNTSSENYAEDIEQLTSDYNALTASVQNATQIERTVVTKAEVDAGHPVVDYCSLIIGSTDDFGGMNGDLSVAFIINYKDYPPHFQLVTGYSQINIDGTQHTVTVPLTRADVTSTVKRISGTYITDIPVTEESVIVADWTQVVFYSFY